MLTLFGLKENIFFNYVFLGTKFSPFIKRIVKTLEPQNKLILISGGWTLYGCHVDTCIWLQTHIIKLIPHI